MPKANYYNFFFVDEEMSHDFDLKTLVHESTVGVIWEFSCGCCIQFPSLHSSEVVLGEMKEQWGGRLCRKSTSPWGDNWNHLPPTDHFFCREDPKLIERLADLMMMPEEYFHLIEGVSLVPSKDFREANDAMKLKIVFSTPVPLPERKNDFKKAKKLPEALRKTLEAENSRKTTLTDKELEDLFAQPAAKKSKKSKNEKPNKGKAPNNIRKTKKPVKL